MVDNQPSDEAAEPQHSQREKSAAPWRTPSDFSTVLVPFIHLSSIAAWRRFAPERTSSVAARRVHVNALFCRCQRQGRDADGSLHDAATWGRPTSWNGKSGWAKVGA
jgi:hypothetical protein